MSIKVITAVLRLGPAVVTSSERLVLYALAWHADEAGLNAWPSVPTLARETSLTPRAVQKVLRRLNAKGVLFVQARAARGSVRYGVDLQVLDRERAASAGAVDCEPGSQSGHVETPITANHVQGTANQVHPTANVVHPIRPLIVHEPSEKRDPAGVPPAAPEWRSSGRSARDQEQPRAGRAATRDVATPEAGRRHGLDRAELDAYLATAPMPGPFASANMLRWLGYRVFDQAPGALFHEMVFALEARAAGEKIATSPDACRAAMADVVQARAPRDRYWDRGADRDRRRRW